MTLKRQAWQSSQLIGLLEHCWATVGALHPSLPPAVIVLGAGELAAGQGLRLGRFSPCSWQLDNQELHEVFIGAEGLKRGPEPVLATLLHEAAHGLAHAAQIKDTSRGGRYHNRRYQRVAETVGLQVAHHPQLGWSVTQLTDTGRARYATELAALAETLAAHRNRRRARTVAPKNRNLPGCSCHCGRRIRVSASTLAQAPILCARCYQPFRPDLHHP